METVPEMAAVVALVPVKGEILPDPLAPKPIAVFELVHVNDAPVGLLMKAGGDTVPPHCVIFEGVVATGLGFTVIVNVNGVPVQPLSVGVTEMVLVIAEAVALVAVNAGKFPVPDAPRPIPVLELVQAKVAPVGVLVKLVNGTAAPAQ